MQRTLINVIFNHWRLKTLSVVLAAAAWMVSYGRDYMPVSAEATLTLNPPRDGQILQAGGAAYTGSIRFSVDLYGPRGKIEMLAGRNLNAQHRFDNIDVNTIEPGTVLSETLDLQTVRIKLEDGDLPQGIEIRKTHPRTIEVKIDRNAGSPLVPIDPVVHYTTSTGASEPVGTFPTSDGCAEGFQMTKIFVTPTRANVLGPASIVRDLKRLKTMPVMIGDLRGTDPEKPIQYSARIDAYVDHKDYGRVKLTCDRPVTVNISVAENLQVKTLRDIPVRVLKPAHFWPIVEIKKINGRDVDAADPKVDLEIKGTSADLQIIRPADVKVFLDVTDVQKEGDSERVLDVQLPRGIQLVKPPVAGYKVSPVAKIE